MRTSITKTLIALTLVLLLSVSAAALGESRYPASSGALTDDANAIGQTMAGDIAAYAQTVESTTGVRLHVALVLFWDGETAQTYADTLFERWGLGEDDLLLAGAAAEDTFALASGANVKAKLSDGSLNSLLYSSGFAENFRTQQYDAAFGTYFVAFNNLLNRQYGQTLALGSLFAAYQPTAVATQAPQSSSDVQAATDSPYMMWNSTMAAIGDSVRQYQDNRQNEGSGGLTPGGWVVLVILVLIILGQSKRTRRSGCGCSPIGWILGGLGLGTLFGRRGDAFRQGGPGCGHTHRR
ncbi:MAG: TPM domain-containing protein [Eubacteriales bacterium]|nr:TPM domain-containing protein [Eubacteriales bacterium]